MVRYIIRDSYNSINIANKKKYNQVIYWSIIFLYALLTLFSMEKGILILSSLGYLLLILIAIFAKVDFDICLLAFTIPISNLFKLWEFDYTIIPIIEVIIIFKYYVKNQKISKSFFMYYYLLFLISIINSLFRYETIIPTLAFFTNILFSYIVIASNDNFKKVFNKSSIILALSSCLSCIGSIIFPRASLVLQQSDSGSLYRFYGLLGDSTQFAQILVVSISFLLVMYVTLSKNKIIYLLIASILSYFLILSGTRSTIISIIFLTLYFCIYFITNKKKLHKIIAIVIVPLILIIAVNSIKQILNIRINASLDNGRFEIWLNYLEIFLNDIRIFLFGIGGGAISSFAKSNNMLTVHNGFIEKIIEFGVIGFPMFVVLIKQITHNNILNPFKNYHIIPVYSYIFTLFTLGMTGSELLFYLLAVCCYRDKNKEDMRLLE